jgi:hypothetical protein
VPPTHDPVSRRFGFGDLFGDGKGSRVGGGGGGGDDGGGGEATATTPTQASPSELLMQQWRFEAFNCGVGLAAAKSQRIRDIHRQQITSWNPATMARVLAQVAAGAGGARSSGGSSSGGGGGGGDNDGGGGVPDMCVSPSTFVARRLRLRTSQSVVCTTVAARVSSATATTGLGEDSACRLLLRVLAMHSCGTHPL